MQDHNEMPPGPKVSVVIPVYNVQDFVGECVVSVIEQELAEVEILVVDDGSRDESVDRVNAIIDRTGDKRVRIIRQENQGLSAARNTGASQARGEYLYFLDGDDWIDRETLRRMYDEAKKNDADIVICDYKKRYPSRTEVMTGGHIPYLNEGDSTRIYKDFLTGRIVVAAWNKLYRTSFYHEHGFKFPVGHLFEDIPLTNLIAHANRIVKLDEPFYNYRQREGSIMRTLSRKILKKYELVNDIAAQLKQRGIFDRLHQEYQYFYNDLIVLQIVNNCLGNGTQDKKMSDEIIGEILSMPDTRYYFKGLLSNPYLSMKHKVGLSLLRYSPGLYKVMFRLTK